MGSFKKGWINEKLCEECGVFGVHLKKNADVAELCYLGLYALQHRGQESAGIAISDGDGIDYYKEMGLVAEVFDSDRLAAMKKGRVAIGHVRYSTTGSSNVVNAQPLVVKYRKGYLALSHNGNLVNAARLRTQLEDEGAIFQTSNDSEVIAYLIARKTEGEDIIGAIEKTMELLSGSYALCIMTEDILLGVRDPLGIRPLCIGELDGGYVIASETCALDTVGARFLRDVAPGEIVAIDKDGLRSCGSKPKGKSGLCIFEFVYFARTDSTIDGVSVYQARIDAGKILARTHPADADIVIGVPDSALTAAMGFAEESGIPYGDGLVKNRYVGRTFIQPDQMMRERGVQIKLNALKRNIDGKRVVMVDDSIVRGTTSKRIVEMLRRAGAREVHMRISSPPVCFPCYFGIDTPDRRQLLGANNTIEGIRRLIGADSLGYLDTDDLYSTVSSTKCGFCTGCFTGKYPVEMDAGDMSEYLLEKQK
ncbi:MAG: amidophosphoribosyltransferase [Bacillota bacterium]|nr:amidophosphoribosyltransferase [Bacillota bacterium]